MYTRDPFSLPSLEAECAFVRSRSFGVLASCHDGEVFTSPLPIDLRGGAGKELFVAGHVAAANDMAAVFAERSRATVTVVGRNTYVPAEWFGVRSRIPTWLYCAVEVSGQLEPVDDEVKRADVERMITRLQHETVDGSTWTLDEIAPNLSASFLTHIVGFRMRELSMKSCFRLNQRQQHGEQLAAALTGAADQACHELAELVLHPPTAPAR